MSAESRRRFLTTAALGMTGAASTAATPPQEPATSAGGQRLPLRIGHRAASMKMVGNFDVFKLARRIPGLDGVELQIAHGQPNLRDFDAVRRYKLEAHRWGMKIPSLAGVWDRGVSIRHSPVAGINLLQSIRAAEMLGASVILVAFFRDNAPDMNDEASYGPVVELLRGAAPRAAEAGVVMGLENSLSPADNKKLADLVAHPSVKIYCDMYNFSYYGHAGTLVSGIKLLGNDRICQVHVKNGKRLIEEPDQIKDWQALFAALNEIGYEGWYVFESQHSGNAQLISSTTKNIEYMRKVCRMPEA